jgi:thymidylate synthase (FAD)
VDWVATEQRVIPENAVPVLDHGFVRLDAAMASDLSVVNSARVSFGRRKEEMDEADEGLIRFLMRDRHGCYDSDTDVLTDGGWKRWPDVTGAEQFATISVDGRLEYQPALRLVRKEYKGHMLGFNGLSLDLLVTPDHRVLTSEMTTRTGRTNPTYKLRPAHSVLWRPHRHLTTARWDGPVPDWFHFDDLNFPAEPLLRLLGFFIGDGNLPPRGSEMSFHLRKERSITFLRRAVRESGLELRTRGSRFGVPVGPDLKNLLQECYVAGEKVIPRRLLFLGPPLLEALYAGLLESDGSRLPRSSGTERHVYSTTSKQLADDVQELSLRIGRGASVRPHVVKPGDGHFGAKARWRVSIYAPRNTRPALCRVRADRDNHMGVERFNDVIHCVEVPNRTLYVRRNGYPVWCGNTPFEHNAFRFHIRAPIFVVREWMRHRIGSFNEFSMRYARATDDFYLPERDDVRAQVGKPGAYSFDPVEPEVADLAREELQAVYDQAYAAYERMVDAGVARELARSALPVGAYTEFFWTVNARALMNFVSLRAAESAQREIRRYADAVETFLAQHMPVTHAAFVAAGRVAP